MFVVLNLREFALGLLQLRLSRRGLRGDASELGFGNRELLLAGGNDAGAGVELRLRGCKLRGCLCDELLGVAGASGEDEQLLTEALRFEFQLVDAGEMAATGRLALGETFANG